MGKLSTQQSFLRGRLTSTQVNSFYTEQNKRYTLISGQGKPIPIVYGTDTVEGTVLAQIEVSGSPNHLYVAVGWGMGESGGPRRVFINDLDPLDGVEVVHYRGTTWQAADPWLVAEIASYTDDLIITTAAGDDIGIAYSVFKIPAGTYSTAPIFKAVFMGRLCEDPRLDLLNLFIKGHYSTTGFAVTWDGAGGANYADGVDHSINGHTITLNGNAAESGNFLELPGGASDYGEVAYDTSFSHVGTNNFTYECKFVTDTVATGANPVLFGFSDAAGDNWYFYRDDASLFFRLSSANSTWDLHDASIATIAASTEYTLIFERIGAFVYIWLDGASKLILHVGDTSFAHTGVKMRIGCYDDGLSITWDGRIRSIRATVGSFRYGSPHTAQAASDPYPDWDTQTGTDFTNNPALHWADLVKNAVFGMGGNTIHWDVVNAVNWADDLGLATDTVARAVTGITLDAPRRVENYLDLLATYANAVWYVDGSDARIKSDEPYTTGVNASGAELVDRGEFDVNPSSLWTYNATYWKWRDLLQQDYITGKPSFYMYGDSIATDQTLSQTLTTVNGTQYAVRFDLVDRTPWEANTSTGSVSLDFGGVERIAATSTPGRHVAIVTASGTSNALEIIATSGFTNGVDNVSVRPLFWTETEWVQDSLTLPPVSESDTPTQVIVKYRDQDLTTPLWPEKFVTATATGVSTGDVPLVQTTLYLPGVNNSDEAQDKADAKLARMTDKVRVSWVSTDSGIVQQKGDVVRLISSHRGIDVYVYVESVQMVDYGRWRVSGLKYLAVHYPS